MAGFTIETIIKKFVKKTTTAIVVTGIFTRMVPIFEINNRWFIYFSAAISFRNATQ